jgi:hypothetical protein
MRLGSPKVALMSALCLWGCGYMGEPMPPALNRPERVLDLSALEHGSNIIVQFTIPTITTEGLPVKDKDRDIELRVGPPGAPFNMDTWQRTSDRIPVVVTNAKAKIARVEVPAMKYYGNTVDIAVNVHGPDGHTAGWSMFAIVQVVPALPTPEALTSSDVPDAVQLEWHAAAPEFRVFRKLVADANWTLLGTSTKPSYTDNMIDYDKTYEYMIQSIEKTTPGYAESDLSDVTTIKPMDKFPPAVPVGVTAVPGTRTIELVWNRNTEKDFAGYRIYRDGKRITEGLAAPAFTDRDVQPRVTYRYEVSAVDTAGNESSRSPAVEATIP